MEGQIVSVGNNLEALGVPEAPHPKKRPRRQAAVDAIEKIHDILDWEGCKENSEMFKLVKERINMEFEQGRPLDVEEKEEDDAEVEEVANDEEEDDESDVGSLVNFVKDDDSDIEYDTGASNSDEEGGEENFSDDEDTGICTDDLVSEGDDTCTLHDEDA